MMTSADYATYVNCIEDMLYKLKVVIPVLKRCVTLILEDTYALIAIMTNVISGKIYILV
jgi:hypothetical protein